MNGAKHGVLYRLYHTQMLHLRIVEYLIYSVNRPAGYTGLIEEGNQLLTVVALGIRLDSRVERIAMLRARSAVRIARVIKNSSASIALQNRSQMAWPAEAILI